MAKKSSLARISAAVALTLGCAVDPADQQAKALVQGTELFKQQAEGKKACASCHPGSGGKLTGAATRFPRYAAPPGRVATLTEYVYHHGQAVGAAPPEPNTPSAASLALYIVSLSEGMPLQVGDGKRPAANPSALPTPFPKGKRTYTNTIQPLVRAKTCLTSGCHPTDRPLGSYKTDAMYGIKLLAQGLIQNKGQAARALNVPELTADQEKALRDWIAFGMPGDPQTF